MTFSENNKKDRKEERDIIDSPFQDEALFSEEETNRAARTFESRLLGYEDESPFFQAFACEETQTYQSQLEESEVYHTEKDAVENFTDYDQYDEPEMKDENLEELLDEMEEVENDFKTEDYKYNESVDPETSIHEVDEYLDGEDTAYPENILDDHNNSEFSSTLELDSERLTPDDENYYDDTENAFDPYQTIGNDLERVPSEYENDLTELIEGESGIHPGDTRIDVRAKFALPKMLKRPDTKADAARLIEGVNSGQLAGIYGDDIRAAVNVAAKQNISRMQLVPKGEDASLVLHPKTPLTTPPTVIFRGDTPDISKQPERFYAALSKASQTFLLLLSKKLGSCSTPKSLPIANLLPKNICQIFETSIPPNILIQCPPTKSREFNTGLQKFFRKLGLPITKISGIFDTQTQNALKIFQKRQGLVTSGKVDYSTQRAMHKAGFSHAVCPPPPPDSITQNDFPVLTSSTGAEFVREAPPKTKMMTGYWCLLFSQGHFGWFCSYDLSLPKGVQTGLWQTGFVQNVIYDRMEMIYGLPDNQKRIHYEVSELLLDIPDENIYGFFFGFEFKEPNVGKENCRNPTPFYHNLTPKYTFHACFADAPEFSADYRLNGEFEMPLTFLKREIAFKVFLVSRGPSNQTVIHAVGEEVRVVTTYQQTCQPNHLVPRCQKSTITTTINPQSPQLCAVHIPNPPDSLIKLSGPSANEKIRSELIKLGVHKSCGRRQHSKDRSGALHSQS